jgi:BlaR1 peptidase M56
MERECCLSMLIALAGGATLLACGWWPVANIRTGDARRLEKVTWRRIWMPVAPALAVAAALCGWALVEPDPVPETVPLSLILMSLPFALLFARAAVRGGQALIADGNPATATVGLLRPRVVFSPHLAKALDDRQIEAALEHERAHARHRDPLRIWLAQIATDLQWPWPQARTRLQRWLIALELARDDEARAVGIEGTDLAEAIVASARFCQKANPSMQAALSGERAALKERIARLLHPMSEDPKRREATLISPLLALIPTLAVALALGSIFGERVIRALFRIAA